MLAHANPNRSSMPYVMFETRLVAKREWLEFRIECRAIAVGWIPPAAYQAKGNAMLELLFSDNATWFSVPALAGTGIFLVRLVLMFLGQADLGIDLEHPDTADIHHGDVADFKIISIQAIAAFAMGFGWGGLGILKGSAWNPWLAVPVGIACGAAMVWLLALLLKGVYDLQSSGNIKIADTVGVEGAVYVTVPGDGQGTGQVQLVLDNRQRIYNAITPGAAIATKSRVRVVGVNDDNTVTVQPI
jgi:hypothetical protein